jgi:hypothetical protein
MDLMAVEAVEASEAMVEAVAEAVADLADLMAAGEGAVNAASVTGSRPSSLTSAAV